jgi:hypothetical protein
MRPLVPTEEVFLQPSHNASRGFRLSSVREAGLSGGPTLVCIGTFRWHREPRRLCGIQMDDSRDGPRCRGITTQPVPRFPREMFLALLFSAFPLLKGWCSSFLSDHAYFMIVYVCCTLSTATWLLIAFLPQPFSDRTPFLSGSTDGIG